MSESQEDLVFFGWDGIIFADRMREYIKEKARRVRERERKIEKIKAEVRDLKQLLEEQKKDAEQDGQTSTA